MGNKIRITADELCDHVRTQYHLLKNACYNYDKGDLTEALNIGMRLRVLAHNQKSSKSLLHNINIFTPYRIKIRSQHDTIKPNCFFYLFPTIRIQDNTVSFQPNLESRNDNFHYVDYKDWWDEEMVIVNKKIFSRADIILTHIDQEGGAHVDLSVDMDYRQLTRGDLLNIQKMLIDQHGRRISLDSVDVDTLPKIIIRESGQDIINAMEEFYDKIIA